MPGFHLGARSLAESSRPKRDRPIADAGIATDRPRGRFYVRSVDSRRWVV
ncbi:MAG: hypothetical protein QOG46_2459 [Pseudonocardiales bacterium]|nr:hypothetical protein [Pseudonocardiales bacterium]